MKTNDDKTKLQNVFDAIFEHIQSNPDETKQDLKDEGFDLELTASADKKFIANLRGKLSAKINRQQKQEAIIKQWKHKSILKLIQESGNADPIGEIRSRARELVLTALDNGWSGPPYNAIELAKILKFDITPNDSLLDARILPAGNDCFKIEYNPYQKPTRINFSVAHEITHTFFSDCAEAIRNREDYPNDNRELEQLCNIGASEIQLPYAVFTDDANSIDVIDLESLIELAKRYKASLESLFIRFTEVIDRPCAIMICAFNEDNTKLSIEYVNASASFDVRIPSGFIIPNDSKAYNCTSPGWSDRETVEWDFLGSKYHIYCIGISPLRKDNRARVGIIIVPSEDSEDLANRKIVMEFGDATKPTGSGTKIIAQVVNTSGALGLGFGKSLAKNYPEVKTALNAWKEKKSTFKLGESQLVQVGPKLYVFQMLAQKGLFEKNGEIPLKYSSLTECIIRLRDESIQLNASVHMPLIGAGQAKGDWNIIQGIIHDELISKGIDVKIYVFPSKVKVPSLKTKSSLTIFKEESTWGKGK